MRNHSDQFIAVGFALFVILGVAYVLYRPRVQQSKQYQAIVVPLANIMDVGFIVLSPAVVLLAGFAALAVIAAGCGGSSNKPVGMVVIYEVDMEHVPSGFELTDSGMQAALAVMDRRLNPGRRKAGRVRMLEGGRIEVSIFREDLEKMQRIADLLPRPGTFEFRILANHWDHQDVIDRATAEPESQRLRGVGGLPSARWVPVRREAEGQLDVSRGVVSRKGGDGENEMLQVLVVEDLYNVNGAHLAGAAVGKGGTGDPCLEFTLTSAGAERLGGLTGANLPNPADQSYRLLGIVLDGQLHSAPRIASQISKRGVIEGNFTEQEVLDIVRVLSAGSLPVPIRKVEQHLLSE